MALLSFAAPISSHAQVVISQVYGGGGNIGALFRNDFVELFNRGTNLADLAGWSVQYASAAGTTWQTAPLSGSLPPGHYFLLQLASGGVNGLPLPAPDATGSLNLSASAGKVALVETATPLSGACPSSADILDRIGFGNTASCQEGIGPAPGGGNALAVIRASGGCIDTDNNASDFFTSAPTPRNRGFPTNGCGSAPLVAALHSIQGGGAVSPLAGQLITTTINIVTGIRNNGFFLQSPDADADADAQTSEAVFISTPSGPPPGVAVGDAVVVTGIVGEFRPASDPAAPPRTQIINPLVTVMDTGRPLPAATVLSGADLRPDGPVEQLERLEAMRVRLDDFKVVGPTEGFIIESSATGVSDGVFYGVLDATPRPMREPGIPLFDPLPADAPPEVPRFDMNPERLRIDSNAQPGAPRLEVAAGTVISNLIGVLDFEQRTWTLLPDAGGMPVLSSNAAAIPVPPVAGNEFTVASFNLERFFDATEDPSVDETVLTTNAFNGRLNKASRAIRHVLRAPDILGVVEIENLATLQMLANRVNFDALVAGPSNVSYAAWLEEGNDVGGIDSGFLVNTARVAVLDVTQFGKDTTYTNPLTGGQDTLNDRPPLVLRATVPRPGFAEPLPVTVILNHLRSMREIDDPTDGPRIRAKRRAQAEYLAGLVQERQTNAPAESLVLIGDFNAFPFNDGYVDVLGTIKGSPAPANEVTLASADLVEPDLINLTDELPATERYSFNFEGNAQALDHILVNVSLHARLVRYQYARLGSDFPESFRSNFNRPERLSDHDAAVAWFELAKRPGFVSIRRLESGPLELSWQAEPLQSFRVEASTDLVAWSPLDTVVADGLGRGVFITDQPPDVSSQFYRLAAP
jgi:predicted extracellular nuclease